MTDRDLLEKAAKAAGLTLDKSPYNGSGGNTAGFDMVGNAVLDWHNGVTWNPLTDDGDAFQLAVKLDLFYMPQIWWKAREDYCAAADAQDRQDPCAATRRAIVRAAANLAGEAK